MKIGIIGAGRVGCAFALALGDRGYGVSGVYNRTFEIVNVLGNKLNKVLSNDLGQVVDASDIILLTVSDSFISNAAGMIIAKCSAETICGKTFLHCSGALASRVLEPLASAGANIGSLHPIQTFADRENAWKSMYGIYFGYEGSKEASQHASELVSILNGTMLDIKLEAKPLYHAAASILSNYMATLAYASEILLENAGIERELGIKAFMPLLKNTAENIGAFGSEKALTGPIARGDVRTVAGHIEAIKALDDKILEVYKAVGRMTVELAIEKGGIDMEKANALLDALSGNN